MKLEKTTIKWNWKCAVLKEMLLQKQHHLFISTNRFMSSIKKTCSGFNDFKHNIRIFCKSCKHWEIVICWLNWKVVYKVQVVFTNWSSLIWTKQQFHENSWSTSCLHSIFQTGCLSNVFPVKRVFMLRERKLFIMATCIPCHFDFFLLLFW